MCTYSVYSEFIELQVRLYFNPTCGRNDEQLFPKQIKLDRLSSEFWMRGNEIVKKGFSTLSYISAIHKRTLLFAVLLVMIHISFSIALTSCLRYSIIIK